MLAAARQVLWRAALLKKGDQFYDFFHLSIAPDAAAVLVVVVCGGVV